jgi:hypothetical protein
VTFAALDADAQAARVADQAEALALSLIDEAGLSPAEAGRVCLVAAWQLLAVVVGGPRLAALLIASWGRTVSKRSGR